MKTKLLLMFLFLTITLQAQTNLVPNGNFENWTSSSQPDNWFRYFNGLVFQSTSAQNGSSSTKMQITSGTFNYINSEFFPVVAGKTYRITMYHKLVTGTFSAIDLSLYHKPGTFKSEITKKTDVVTTSTEWRKIEFDYTPTVSESIEVDIWTTGTLNSEILVDNVSVVDVSFLGSQYTLIPDINFETKLISLGIDSGAPDGKVVTSNIASVTSLNVSFSNIADLTGIQDFRALTGLFCYFNNLTTVDLSKNLALTELYFDGNKLTSLDVSKNIALKTLSCYTNNIISLDVSRNVGLTELYCSGNQLISLDTKNPSLKDLYCEKNKLTSLDLSNNLALSRLKCGTNQLISLDLSQNPNLQSISCSSNQLVNLNLKNGKNTLIVTNVLDLTLNPNLKCVLVDDETYANTNWSTRKDATASFNATDCNPYTLIPDLNFEKKLIELGHDSGAPDGKVLTDKINKLKELEISSNNITELTGIQDFVALEKLSCIKNSLSSLDLRKNLNLMILDCEENSLTNIDVTKNDKLKELHCSYNKLSDLNVSNNKILEKISCTTNQLSVLDVKNLTSLIELYCDKNQLKNLDLSKNISLTDLDCSNNQLTLLNLKNGKNDILIKEYLLLTNNPNLTCIQVDNKTYSDTNWSSNKDATATFNTDCTPYTLIPDIKFENKLIALGIDKDGANGKVATENIAKLTTLDVSNSYILDLSGIQDFVALKTLNFSNNLLSAINLSKNIALTEINGESNKITTIDLSKNVALTDFKFSYNLATTLDFSTNVNLVNLSCFSNKLASINLGKNIALTTVDLSWNQLTNIDLSNNKNIISLYLHYNKLTTVDFSHQTTLQSLVISSNLLTNLDLSNNLNLKILYCGFNPLEALDLSKNKILGFLNCSDTTLKSLNFKNGYNKNIFNSSVNFTNNLLLKCIIVDDVLYSNTNWANKKDTMASFSIIDCDLTTSIPDPKFEDKLISLGIDKDGKNGFVYTSSIVNVTVLDVSNSSIQDLTGIQSFPALKIINCSSNALTSLNLSSNIALTAINCSDNKLSSLNLKNGTNTTLIKTDLNFKNNPSLACIQVDDVVYSNLNWQACKDTNANFNTDCTVYTIIPDPKFEDKLISLGIDKDGKNGKIDTESANYITYLDIANSNITNLTGIQDFVALIYLDCSFNSISNIDVSYNVNLTKLDVTENNLKLLDISKNTKLFNLAFSKNQISSIDLSKNTNLHYVIADRNSLSSLDVSLNTELEIINCGENFLTSLDISKLPKLYHLNCGTNTITTLDVSKNLLLKELYCNNLSLNVLDVTKNIGLRALNCTNNQLTTLDLSQNKVLDFLYINFNPITTLNLQNGNNYKLIIPPVTGKSNSTGQYSSFLNNKNLNCIQVDDENYSNANWSKIKDATAKYSNSCSSLSTSDIVFEKLSVYPNPTKGALFIENVSVNKVVVYDALGKLMNVPFSSNGTSTTANLEQFPKGIYYMYIESEGETTVRKVIVE